MMIVFFNYLRQRQHRVDNGIFFSKTEFQQLQRWKNIMLPVEFFVDCQKRYIFFFRKKHKSHIEVWAAGKFKRRFCKIFAIQTEKEKVNNP
jgi:hypothetical protein